jgi:phosphoribosylanthranilate isomerase
MARLGEMVLAGGLRPDNVGRAITRVRPFGVDVSSGVESSPGEKSPELIRAFVAAVRAAEERQVRV